MWTTYPIASVEYISKYINWPKNRLEFSHLFESPCPDIPARRETIRLAEVLSSSTSMSLSWSIPTCPIFPRGQTERYPLRMSWPAPLEYRESPLVSRFCLADSLAHGLVCSVGGLSMAAIVGRVGHCQDSLMFRSFDYCETVLIPQVSCLSSSEGIILLSRTELCVLRPSTVSLF